MKARAATTSTLRPCERLRRSSQKRKWMMKVHARLYLLAAILAALAVAVVAQAPDREAYAQRSREFSARMESTGLKESFKGITTSGTLIPNLFPIRSTGVTTAPVRSAAAAFVASLSAEQRPRTVFPVDDVEWRKWANQHVYFRQGMSFDEMSAAQREAAFAVLGVSLSAKGLKL